MAKKDKKDAGWNNFRPRVGREDQFHYLVSGLGADGAQTQTYSPDREVTGSAPQGPQGRKASKSESARDQRREG